MPSCRSYTPPLWLWNVDNLSTVYKEAIQLSHDLFEKDSQHHMAKIHPGLLLLASTASWCNHSFVGPVISTGKITASRRNCSTANYLRASAPKEARKSASKTHWKSPWNLLISPLIAWNIWRRTETSGVKLSNVERMSVKSEETQQLSYAGNLEKAQLHQPLPLPSLVPTVKDSSTHRLVSLAICAFTDAIPNHKVDQMVFIDYDGQRREKEMTLRIQVLKLTFENKNQRKITLVREISFWRINIVNRIRPI